MEKKNIKIAKKNSKNKTCLFYLLDGNRPVTFDRAKSVGAASRPKALRLTRITV